MTNLTEHRQPFGLRVSHYIGNVLDQLQPPESLIQVATALIVGVGGGLGAIGFRYLIDGVNWLGFTWLPRLTGDLGLAYVVIAPTIGGLVVGPLIYFFAREAKGHGVPEVMEAIALRGGRIRPAVVVVKSLASSLSIGSGGSVGREGPIVQIGSALGSNLGQALHLSEERIRTLVAAGAAAGIAATFNAPIAGVIFALEVILGEFTTANFSTVVVSAVAASLVSQTVFEDVPAFPLPEVYHIASNWEFAFYPILAVLAALVAWVFVKLLYWGEDIFEAMKRVPEWLQPALGGLLLGGLVLLYNNVQQLGFDSVPQVYGVGYDVIGVALAGNIAVGVVLILLVLKIVATTLTLGSGGSGGVFAPSLFMGAMLGSAFGIVLNNLFPGVVAPPGAYALVGMGAVFAGAAHAPMTATIILFELTGDYRIILPLMLTVVISTLLARWFLGGESVYTLKLSRRGVHLSSGRDVDILQSVTVGEVMTTTVTTISSDSTIGDLARLHDASHLEAFPVLGPDDRVVGMVAMSDYNLALIRNVPRTTLISDIATMQDILVIGANEPVATALQRMSTRGIGRLPVVSDDDEASLQGIVSHSDIARAYQMALTRRASVQYKTERIRLRSPQGTEFVDIELQDNSVAVGQPLTDIAPCLPRECVLVSVRRDGQVIIPRGDTIFMQGDTVTAYARSVNIDDLRGCLLGQAQEEQDRLNQASA